MKSQKISRAWVSRGERSNHNFILFLALIQAVKMCVFLYFSPRISRLASFLLAAASLSQLHIAADTRWYRDKSWNEMPWQPECGERQNNIRRSFIRETLPVLQPEIKFYFDDGLKPGSCLRSTLSCCVQLLSLLSVLHDRMKITVHWHTRSALATWSSWLKWDGLSRVKLQYQKKGNGQIKVVITCAGWICMQA